MLSRFPLVLISLVFSRLLAGCDGDGAFTPAPSPQPGPSPGGDTAAGLWLGQAETPDIPDIVTGFEFNDPDGFVLGNEPFTAEFEGGATEIAASPDLTTDGTFSWHVGLPDASVTFETPGSSLSLFTRTVFAGNNATIRVLDEFGVEIASTVVTNNFEEIAVDRAPGQSLIGSVVVEVNTGEIVIDSFSFGFPDNASTDDITCLLAPEPRDDFACIIADATTGEPIAGANGTYQDSGDEISGSGNLYAAPGETLPDGSTVAPLAISDGTYEDSDSLNMTVDSLGLSITVTTLFDALYDRGASLATVADTYTTFELFGDPSSFVIDNNGDISGQTASGCMLSGRVSVIDATANAYFVDLLADNATCGALGGDYGGLGTTRDDAVMDDQFLFAVFVDGQQMIAGEAIK